MEVGIVHVLVDAADTISRAGLDSSIAVFTPASAPGVAYDVILDAILDTIADSDDGMVN